ncbi:hypothetical protein IWX78_002264 [Mycetocola sp. CAN_C7]|uniref:Ig-like domain-containing protein n=1 Tax=Mycetocola sp. CAN_C7 TaxID=2787724 RepID=UPI0018CA96B6
MLALIAPAAAHAEPDPVAPESASAPTITSPVSGSFIGSSSATVTGTKTPNSEIQVLAGSSRTNVCTVDNDKPTWSCAVSRLPSGPGIVLSAVQLVPGMPNTESEPVTLDILAPPTIAAGSAQPTSGLVQGGGYPDATITLSIGGGRSWSFPAASDGTWAYVLPRTIGSGTFTVTATQSTSFSEDQFSGPSAARRILLDVDPPGAPRITSPTAGSALRPAGSSFSGTGENGATVDVFAVTASGSDVAVCTATVSRGNWSCTSESLPTGTLTVTAFQKDVAGNVGGGSRPVGVRVAEPAAATPAPDPTQGVDPSPAPVAPVDPPSASPTPTAPTPTSPDAGPPPMADSWVSSTPFTSGVPVLGAGELSWLRALILAGVAILLLLVPARMLATTVGGRRPQPQALSLTGRNRVPTHDDPLPLVASPSAIAAAIGIVVAAGGIALFANPVHGQPEYLRVFLASVVAVALLNLASTVLPRLLARQLFTDAVRVTLAPRLLLTVGVVALLSRVLDLQPALVFGIVFTATVAAGARSTRGVLALLRVGTVFVFGVLAWLASTLLGPASGFIDTLLTEVANIGAMAGIGSAAILLIPLGRLDGRALLVWSRPVWFAAATIVLTVLFALLAPVVDVWQTNGGILIAVFIGLGFGALGFSVWLWRRVIQPALTAD